MEYKEINELPNRLREPLVEYHAKQSFIRNPDIKPYYFPIPLITLTNSSSDSLSP
jgi:hypothetical protein